MDSGTAFFLGLLSGVAGVVIINNLETQPDKVQPKQLSKSQSGWYVLGYNIISRTKKRFEDYKGPFNSRAAAIEHAKTHSYGEWQTVKQLNHPPSDADYRKGPITIGPPADM